MTFFLIKALFQFMGVTQKRLVFLNILILSVINYDNSTLVVAAKTIIRNGLHGSSAASRGTWSPSVYTPHFGDRTHSTLSGFKIEHLI